MRVTTIHAPRDIRLEERPLPRIEEPTQAIVRVTAACVCGSDLWYFRGVNEHKVGSIGQNNSNKTGQTNNSKVFGQGNTVGQSNKTGNSQNNRIGGFGAGNKLGSLGQNSSNTTGQSNTATGVGALISNIDGGGNTATGGFGGGIYNIGTTTIDASLVGSNWTDGNGGGIHNAGTLTIQNGELLRVSCPQGVWVKRGQGASAMRRAFQAASERRG